MKSSREPLRRAASTAWSRASVARQMRSFGDFDRSSSRSAKEQGCDLVEMIPPDSPLVSALGEPPRVLDPLGHKGVVKGLVSRARQHVILPDAHPKQLELLVRCGR